MDKEVETSLRLSMRRTLGPTPRLDLLRTRLAECLRRRGTAAKLARACSVAGKEKRQLVSVWFRKGEGRPTAVATMKVARFLVAQPEWDDEKWFIPTWVEMLHIAMPLLSLRGRAADLARFCGREPSAICRYFAASPRQRRQPDGEVALATFDWLTRGRVEYSFIDTGLNPEPSPDIVRALRRAFDLEDSFKLRYEQKVRRRLPLPWQDLFCGGSAPVPR